MDQSSSFTSNSEYYFAQNSLSESSLLLSGVNDSQVSNQQSRRQSSQPLNSIFIECESLEKYHELFVETIRLLSQRASDPQFQHLSKNYQELHEEIVKQLAFRRPSAENSSQNKKEEQDLVAEHQKVIDKLDELNTQMESLLGKMEQLSGARKANIQKRRLLYKLLSDSVLSKEDSPFFKVAPKYSNAILKLIKNIQQTDNNSQQSQSSSSGAVSLQESMREKNLRKIAQKQIEITKFNEECTLIKSFTLGERNQIQNLKKAIENRKAETKQLFSRLEQTEGQIGLKLDVVGDIISKMIDQHTQEPSFNHGIQRPISDYLDEIDSLTKQVQNVRKQLLYETNISSQMQNKCTLLKRRLQELRKKPNQLQKFTTINQNQSINQQHINDPKSVSNQQLILKTYEIQNNQIRSEKLRRLQQISKTDLPSQLYPADNQTDNCNSLGVIMVGKKELTAGEAMFSKVSRKILPRRFGQLLNIVLIVWVLILVFCLCKPFLVESNLWPFSHKSSQQPIVIHRYEGRHKWANKTIISNVETIQNEINQQFNEKVITQDDVIMVQEFQQHINQNN